MPDLQGPFHAALQYLTAAQQSDGGWSYRPNQSPVVEATAAAAIALAGQPEFAAAHERAAAWLIDAQHADGGWGIASGDSDSGWQTGWAVLALRAVPTAQETVAAAVNWLVAVEFWRPETLNMETDVRELLGHDPNYYGWPWMPGEATWVEPTALALLALVDAPREQETAGRMERALRFLKDRRCRDGGWNVGNPIMLGAYLPPRAHPTAWALLALARLAPDAIIEMDIETLQREIQHDGGTPALAWGILALAAVGRSVEGLLEQLAELQALDGSWDGNAYHTAVAALALSETREGIFRP